MPTTVVRDAIVWLSFAVVVGIIAIAMLPPAEAQSGLSTTAVYDAYDHDSVAVSTVAVAITASKVLPTGGIGARQATCVVETNAMRIRYDGTDPTTSVGLLYSAGTAFAVYGSNNIRRLRAIRVSADGTLQCQLAR
jgi:hypothetical protein